MHSGSGRIHGIENHQVATAIVMAFESNNAERVPRLLEVNGGQEGLAHGGPVASSCSGKVSLHGRKERFVGQGAAIFVVAKLLNSAIDLCIEEESLGL